MGRYEKKQKFKEDVECNKLYQFTMLVCYLPQQQEISIKEIVLNLVDSNIDLYDAFATGGGARAPAAS